MSDDHVVLKRASDGQFYWVKMAGGNNEILSLSETFTRKDDARQAAEREARTTDPEMDVIDETEAGDVEG